MPVPFLAPLIGSLLASSTAGAAITGAVTTALGGAAATGIGSLLASAAPAALGAGIGTLAAGGRPDEALANATMFGLGGSALSRLGAAGAASEAAPNPMAALRIAERAGLAGSTPQTSPMQPLGIGEARRPPVAAPMSMAALPQAQPAPSPIPMAPQQVPVSEPMVAQPAMYGQEQFPAMYSPGTNMMYPQGGVASAMAQREFMPMMRDGGYVEGPGTGRSDSVNAMIYQNGVPVQEARLSDGEFVMTERAVRGAGNGDREEGAAKMYRMMKEFERGGRV
jgi:hypothetical protein